MAYNRKKNTNTLPVGTFAKSILAAFFISVAALGLLYLKYQLHVGGNEIRNLERELSGLVTQNDVMRGRVADCSSRVVLQRRLREGFIKMIPVSDDRIVRINTSPARIALGEMRPVMNGVMAK